MPPDPHPLQPRARCPGTSGTQQGRQALRGVDLEAVCVLAWRNLMSASDQCSPEEWTAFWKMGQIREIASPGFAGRVVLAHEEGLLSLILAGDLESVEKRASELLTILSAQIHSEYRPIPDGNPRQEESLVEISTPSLAEPSDTALSS
jgi:hypothetical protein